MRKKEKEATRKTPDVERMSGELKTKKKTQLPDVHPEIRKIT